jgi:hypothetical protein
MGVLFIENLLAALGASAFTGLLLWLWRVFVDPRLKQRRRRAVLGFDADESDFAPTIIVESTTPSSTARYLRPTVGYGAVLAATNVAQLISMVRSRVARFTKLEVWMDTDQIATRALSEESQHAIVIGGPMSNAETDRYLKWLNGRIKDGTVELEPSEHFVPRPNSEPRSGETQPICFDDHDPQNGRALIVDGNTFRASLTSMADTPVTTAEISQLSGTDYGILIRGPARNLSGRLVIIAGVHTFGLAGASQYLVQLSAVRRFTLRRIALQRNRIRKRREILQALRYFRKPRNEDLVFVVRTDFECGVIVATEPVAAWRIKFRERIPDTSPVSEVSATPRVVDAT